MRACFYQLRRLKQVRRVLGQDVTASLVSALVISKLDYCNAVYAGLPKSSIAPLQRVQNAAARLVLKLGPRDHVTPAFHQLHWLPVEHRIQFKLCLIMHHLHVGHGPSCLQELVQATTDLPGRSRLRSSRIPITEIRTAAAQSDVWSAGVFVSGTHCLELSTPVITVTG